MDDLEPGLHEALVTEALRARIELARAAGWLVEWKEIDDASLAVMLARHIHDRAVERFEAIPHSTDNRNRQQVALANRVLEALGEYSTASDIQSIKVDPEARVLLEVDKPGGTRQSGRPRPGIPLTSSALLVNAHRELQIGTQVSLEIMSADRIDLLVRIRAVGRRPPDPRESSQAFLLSGKQMRVIASVYTGPPRSARSTTL